jgi:flagellin
MSVINSTTNTFNIATGLDQMQEMVNRSITRLSTGSKAADAADAPSSLAQAGTFSAQNGRLQAAATNIQGALSYVQTADGFMGGMSTFVSRLSQLAVMAQDPTKAPSDVSLYQQEFTALQDQLRSTIGGTTAEIGGVTDVNAPLGVYNGVSLFGSGGTDLSVAVGQTTSDTATIPQSNLQSGSMLDLITQDSTGAYTLNIGSPGAVSTLNDAIDQLASARADNGAAQARLNLANVRLQVESQNLTSAISSINDTDVAQESTQLAKYNILVQSGAAMLAQANQVPKSVLELLKA